MIIHTPLTAGNLPIKTLVARQQPTKTDIMWKIALHKDHIS